MSDHTPLYQQHLQCGAIFGEFAGWVMPLHYGSAIKEHQMVRNTVGMFDLSHLLIADIVGPQAKEYLQLILANDVNKLTQSGNALHSCMLNPQGGIVDDLLVFYFDTEHYRFIINAKTRSKDLLWLNQYAKDFAVQINEHPELAIIAIEGPKAKEIMPRTLTMAQQNEVTKLSYLQALHCDGWMIARTGYTGEDGFEIILPATEVNTLWKILLELGVKPAGLTAWDSLRIEAGICLYGNEMNEQISPLISKMLSHTIALESKTRNFIGRESLQQQIINGSEQQLVGLILPQKMNLKLTSQQKVYHQRTIIGEITSHTFSPTLGTHIALALITTTNSQSAITDCELNINQQWINARITAPRFVKDGKAII